MLALFHPPSPIPFPLPCLSQASIVTVIHLVNSVDTVEGEGTLLLLPSTSSLSLVLGCEV